MYTDFKVLDGIIPVSGATFDDLFDFVRIEREIIAAGAEAAGYEHARIKAMIWNTIASNWANFRPRSGDRGGFHGRFEADIDGMTKRVMKPLDASYRNLAAAQHNLSRFPANFARWMAPLGRPAETKDEFLVTTSYQKFGA